MLTKGNLREYTIRPRNDTGVSKSMAPGGIGDSAPGRPEWHPEGKDTGVQGYVRGTGD